MTTDIDDPVGEVTAVEADAPAPLRLFTHRVTGSSRQRLLDAFPCELVESDPVDMIVVSTRMPLGQVSGALARFRRMDTVPVVAIVHAGGEELATELVRAGAVGLVAEGNEAAVAAYVNGGDGDASLVETYDQRLGRVRPSDLGSPGRDPVTGLPSRGAFDAVLAEATQSGEVPRVGFLRVLNHDEAVRRLSAEAGDLLRRRLSSQLREICRLYGARLFWCAPNLYAYVAPELASVDARAMGLLLARSTEAFAPSGGRHLSLAVGHAGPEVTSEVSAVRELAQRALELASSGADSVVLSADDLSRTLAATTELEVLLRLVGAVEQHRPHGSGRGERVADIAGRLAQHLGFEGLERSRIRLAAHLHEIGKVSLAEDVVTAPGQLTDEQLAVYRRYPELGAEYLRVSGGAEVSLAVRHHQERWDGGGYPDGLAAEDIPIGARIIAVAIAVDALRQADPEPARLVAGLAGLAEAAGERFDPTVVSAARTLFAEDRPLQRPSDAAAG
ncbi:MAG: HD domain-containing protein [Actinobacteria bacterium]|nr:HD domain-containing protein [Actinomycetota bacterium]